MKSHSSRVLLITLALTVTLTAGFAQEKKKRNAEGKVDLESEMPADAHKLKLGDAAPDFSLPGIDGKTYSLAQFSDAPVLMVIFLSNHCPCSHAAETRLFPLAREFAGQGLAIVAINPNSPE